MMRTDQLNDTQAEVAPGVWVPALPVPGPLSWRLRDAWAVLRGRAQAIRMPTLAEASCYAPAAHHRDRSAP